MRASAVSLLRQVAKRMDVTEVLAPVDIHDHRRLESGRIRIVPEKEFFSITSEGNFYEMSQFYRFKCSGKLFGPLSQAQEFLPPSSNQLLWPELSQLLEMPVQSFL